MVPKPLHTLFPRIVFSTKVEIIKDIETDPTAAEPASPGESSNALKKRAASAKSHIFRKGKIETK